MKSRVFLLILTLFLLSACGAEPSPSTSPSAASPSPEVSQEMPVESEPPVVLGVELTDELTQRERDWLEDIEFLRNACKNEHIDPFYLCSEEEFDFKLDQLATICVIVPAGTLIFCGTSARLMRTG